MSHFNLNNGMPRKRYIGPTHGLPCRPGTASLENLGGRIIIENEMHNHKLRLKQIKPSIDASKPWAHDYQDNKIRKMSPSRSGGGSNSPTSTSLPPATTAARSSGYGTAYNPNRSNSSSAAAGGQMNASKGRSQSSTPNVSRQGYTTTANNNTSRGNNNVSSSSSMGQHASSHGIAFDVTALSLDQQRTYADLIQLLSTLPQRESKSLLEQAYREGEERKLLMAYTGGFPEAKGKAGGDDKEASKKEKSKNMATESQNKGGISGVRGDKPHNDRSGHTAAPSTTSDAAPSHSSAVNSTSSKSKTGGLSSSQLLRKKISESSAAARSDDDGEEHDHKEHENEDRNRSMMAMSRASSEHSRPSTRGSAGSRENVRADDDGDDSFEKDDDDA